MPWSDDARVMARPFGAYQDLARLDASSPWKELAGRVLFLLFFLGAFVSLTAAGRLVPFHVVSTMVFWSFVPIVQGVAFAVARRASRSREGERVTLPSALALYFTGHGPWLLFLMAIAGVCLFAPDVFAAFVFLLRRGVLVIERRNEAGSAADSTAARWKEGTSTGDGRRALESCSRSRRRTK